ncbi:hypothetical protein [Paenarthrobacter sp. PH39-S1]|uniref:hypothetical protein n=1 Tax=Paenarthrobacter sp. PH39-S1 TaxID=3046204 RepID=UPI0024BBDBB5|nr:hypothetical protein [Paenarthrobacter sp. PH39-S1]MDJ0355259.1 hypothetical protein [Paenarthrobacter sp. PH39-S1]
MSGKFAEIAAEALRGLLHVVTLNRDLADAVEHIMLGLAGLRPHPMSLPVSGHCPRQVSVW